MVERYLRKESNQVDCRRPCSCLGGHERDQSLAAEAWGSERHKDIRSRQPFEPEAYLDKPEDNSLGTNLEPVRYPEVRNSDRTKGR